MVSFQFKNVFIESFALHLPEKAVSSAEIEQRLAPLYEKLRIPFGTLEKLSGIKNRHLWEGEGVTPSTVATVAATEALGKIGFPKEELRALFSCSVTRDYFEPATACMVHRELDLPEDSMVMDISNACIGFSDGISVLGNMIETGVVKAGLLVSGECIARTLNCAIDFMLKDDNLTRDTFLKILPMFTLGSGAVAMVLCHRDLATTTHRVLGAVSKADTANNELCKGQRDYCYMQQGRDVFYPIMETESTKLINSAATLGGKTWEVASGEFGWSPDEIDHIFCHQVGKQVNDAFYKEMGLDIKKEYTIYQEYGNLASAALPTAFMLGAKEKNIQPGEKVLFTAFGSGLNALFTAIEW